MCSLFLIGNSAINIVFDRRMGKVDPVSRVLGLLLQWFYLELDVEFWTQVRERKLWRFC